LVAEFYATRGDEMLDIKDLSAARKFYEYAAEAGSARAVVELAIVGDAAFVPPAEVPPGADHTLHRRDHMSGVGTQLRASPVDTTRP
jgi:TPR repeat protein